MIWSLLPAEVVVLQSIEKKCINDLTVYIIKSNLNYMVHVEVPSDVKANENAKCISNSAFMNGSHALFAINIHGLYFTRTASLEPRPPYKQERGV